MFADRVRVFASAGAGGDGSASFRREAHVPRGGPDGGDGGHGGSVILVAEAGMSTLGDLRHRPHLRAGAGGDGAGRHKKGARGPDVAAHVPPGTVVHLADDPSESGMLVELLVAGDRLVVARGGRGGRGNLHFVSPTHRAPTHFERGLPGEERWLALELKLIADIGLVGAPNAGKSTLLAALTAATPTIAAYPFTTTTPNLGILELDDERRVVIADVPGLIEGAHAGAGLGHEFLRHVERTRALVAVINGEAEDPRAEWTAVEDELRQHDPTLLARPKAMVVTKQDLPAVRRRWPALRRALTAAGHHPLAVSALAGTGLDALRTAIGQALDAAAARAAEVEAQAAVRVHRFDPLAAGWSVVAEGDGLRVSGRRIETAAARIDFTNEESRDRFQRTLERMGIDAELRRMGARDGTLVRIGAQELEWGDEG
jgi:GTP-binding protein